MALIAMAVYDTEENKRTEYTRQTLESLLNTVDFTKHKLFISDNNSCYATQELYRNFENTFYKEYPFKEHRDQLSIWNNGKNLGTAGAINLAWKLRHPGENAIKMDNDIIIHSNDWIGLMEEAISRDKRLGIVGLKRNDCWENPNHTDPFYKSQLIQLPHKAGQHFIAIEEVHHVMGTCQMYSSALLDRIGYLYQPRLYGFDDALAAVRCRHAGFYSAFLCNIYIDHIDAGDTPYQKWKEGHASEQWNEYHQTIGDYMSGKKSIYYNPFHNEGKAN